MSQWRDQAVILFPEYRKGPWAFQRSDVSLVRVFFELLDDLDEKITSEDDNWLARVFEFVEWCYKQRKRDPDVWNAAWTAFLEHMADSDDRAALIPQLVKPPIFEFMWEEFKKRRERGGEGKAGELLAAYNSFHSIEIDY